MRAARLLKEDAIPRHNGLVERQARLRAVPFDELPDGVILRALRTPDARLFRTADFDCSKAGSRRAVLGVRLRLFLSIAPFWQALAFMSHVVAYIYNLFSTQVAPQFAMFDEAR